MIPVNMRKDILSRIHCGHMGVVKCLQRAKDAVYWPGISKDISDMILKCETCINMRNSNAKEPMTPGPTPNRPWDVLATDLFHWNNQDYVLIVDYYSRYVEFSRLEDLSSKSVINHTKSILARHGIPTQIMSDNGPQYTSEEYRRFVKDWGISHTTTSPHYPQANGMAEKFVQLVKRLLNKAKQDNQDPYMSILIHRNTNIDTLASPAQMLMGRRLRTNLPVLPKLLNPQTVDPGKVSFRRRQRQVTQKWYHDRGSRPLPVLEEREKVRMQVQGRWIPATVVSVTDMPHSYIVETASGKKYRRNRRHLMKCHQEDECSLDTISLLKILNRKKREIEMMLSQIWGLNHHN